MDFKLRILLKILNLYILVYFWGFLKEWLIFYELFCEGPSALLKYALTAVRGLKSTKFYSKSLHYQIDYATSAYHCRGGEGD